MKHPQRSESQGAGEGVGSWEITGAHLSVSASSCPHLRGYRAKGSWLGETSRRECRGGKGNSLSGSQPTFPVTTGWARSPTNKASSVLYPDSGAEHLAHARTKASWINSLTLPPEKAEAIPRSNQDTSWWITTSRIKRSPLDIQLAKANLLQKVKIKALPKLTTAMFNARRHWKRSIILSEGMDVTHVFKVRHPRAQIGKRQEVQVFSRMPHFREHSTSELWPGRAGKGSEDRMWSAKK